MINNNSGHVGPLKTSILPKDSNLKTYYDVYSNNGYTIVLSAGNHPEYNKELIAARKENREPAPDQVYKESKKPLGSKWQQGPTPAFPVVERHYKAGGTISLITPAETIAIDIDAGKETTPQEYQAKSKLFYDILTRHGIKERVAIHKTNNGFHAVIRVSDSTLLQKMKSGQKTMLKCGVEVTYRVGISSINSRANIVAAPSHGREWENFVCTPDLATITDELLPLPEYTSFDGIAALLGREIFYYYKSGAIGGNDDIDLSFMGICVCSLKMPLPVVEKVFKFIYNEEYDERRTRESFANTTNKATDGGEVKGIPSWLKLIETRNLIGIRTLTKLFIDKWRSEHVDAHTQGAAKKTRRQLNNEWAVEYIKKNKLICFNNTLYSYNGSYYEFFDKDKLRKPISDFLGNEYSTGYKTDIMNKICDDCRITQSEFNVSENELCLLNGILDVKTLEWTKHTPDKVFFGRFDFNYYLGVTPQPNEWDKFIDSLFPGESHQLAKNTLLRFLGYSLSLSVSAQIGLVLASEGSSGKSTLMNFIEGICPPAFFANFGELSELYADFKNASLEHARISYIDDANKASRFNEGNIKSIITGGTIKINPKHEKPFDIKNRSKLIVGTNKANNFLDSYTHGDMRRWIVIDFPVKFEKKANNLIDNLLKDLLSSQETKDRAGFVLIEQLRKFINAGKFEVPLELVASSFETLQKGNWIYQFAKEHLFYVSKSNSGLKKGEIYKAAMAWATDNGHRQCCGSNFWTEIKRVAKCGPDLDKRFDEGGFTKKAGVDKLCGIDLKGLDVIKDEHEKIRTVQETAIPDYENQISIVDMDYANYEKEIKRRKSAAMSSNNLHSHTGEDVTATGQIIPMPYKGLASTSAPGHTIDSMKKTVVDCAKRVKDILERDSVAPKHFSSTMFNINNLHRGKVTIGAKNIDDLIDYAQGCDLIENLNIIFSELYSFEAAHASNTAHG